MPTVLYVAGKQRALLRATALQEPGEEIDRSCGIANDSARLPNDAVGAIFSGALAFGCCDAVGGYFGSGHGL